MRIKKQVWLFAITLVLFIAFLSVVANAEEMRHGENASAASVMLLGSSVTKSVKLSPSPEPDNPSERAGIAAIIIGVVIIAAVVGAIISFILRKRSLSPKLYLICRSGYQEGRLIPLSDAVSIGRSDDNDIRYPPDYPGVSRTHARITLTNERGTTKVWLEDKSTMGTFLNKAGDEGKAFKIQPNTPIELHVGDVFYLAERENKYELIKKGQNTIHQNKNRRKKQ